MTKFTPLLVKREAYLDKISENCTDDDLAKWDNLRKEIEHRRSLPMPSEKRRSDTQDDRGPRFVDGRLDTVEEGQFYQVYHVYVKGHRQFPISTKLCCR